MSLEFFQSLHKLVFEQQKPWLENMGFAGNQSC